MYDDVCYKRNFLAEVIARIDFATPIESFQRNISSKIIQKVTKHFPIAEPVESVATHFVIGGESMEKEEKRSKQWNFFGKDRDRQLVVTDGAVFVRYTKYSTFEALSEAFGDAVSAIDRDHPGVFTQRFGLRYVNPV